MESNVEQQCTVQFLEISEERASSVLKEEADSLSLLPEQNTSSRYEEPNFMLSFISEANESLIVTTKAYMSQNYGYFTIM